MLFQYIIDKLFFYFNFYNCLLILKFMAKNLKLLSVLYNFIIFQHITYLRFIIKWKFCFSKIIMITFEYVLKTTKE